MIERKNYFDSINCFIEYIKTEGLDKKIVAIYLGGSLGRGDFSPGRSDIDIYIINKEENKDIENKINSKAIEITNTNLAELKKVCTNPFTVAFTNFKAIKDGSSWLAVGPEYYSFIETGKLLLGNDIKDILPLPRLEC
jgi:predicted nucleotidyltransferase